MTEQAPTEGHGKKTCKYCGETNIAATETKCPNCGCTTKLKPCNLCGKPIPEDAKYCNECKSYQDKRRFFTFSALILSLLTTLVAVLTPAIKEVRDFLTRNSDTSMMVKDIDHQSVYIYLWNTGQAPSTLKGGQLVFDESIPLAPAELQPAEIGNTLIRRDAPIMVRLRLSDALHLKPGKTQEQVLEQLKSHPATLLCFIKETNDPNHALKQVLSNNYYAGTRDLIAEGLNHD